LETARLRQENALETARLRRELASEREKPRVGQSVRIVGGEHRKGETGTIIEDDGSGTPFKVKFSDSNTKWFVAANVALAGSRLRVGESVRIVGGEHRKGETGTLIEDDGTGTPFKVKFSDSNTKWFVAANVALAGSRLRVGESVRIVGGEHRMGETGTIIEDDGSGTPFKVKFSDSNTKWFLAANVALAGSRLRVGESVRIVGGEHRKGETGTLIEDDGTGTPFKVKFSDSNTKWFLAANVALAGSRLRVGESVRIVGGEHRMGETGTLIEDDGTGTPFKVKFSDSETKWFVAANVALAGSRPRVGESVRIVGGQQRKGETGTLIEDDGSGTPFKVKFSDSETKWFVAANVALACPGLKLKLEGGSLPGYAAGYPGTYRLVGSKLVNGRPAYQHTSDATRWIAFAGVGWKGQLESFLGEKSGFLHLTDSDAAWPDVSAKTWTAWTGSDWVEAP
jgi:NADH:ubiquinone oxidoreductase subunit D